LTIQDDPFIAPPCLPAFSVHDVHLKRAALPDCTVQVMGRKVIVAVTNFRLDFGT
jgi:hypothetical protein